MQKRKKASRPGAPRGRFRERGDESGVREAKPTTDKGKRGPPDPVSVNVRLPEDLVHELRLRSTERRNAGTEPWTLQGIVREALRGWLSDPKNR